MGTRADFYVGRGETAEWLGSVAWDGYPDGFSHRPELFTAKTADEFRATVAAELADRADSTLPERGWPWPWDDSNTTDYAYAFDGEAVHGSCFGGPWFVPDLSAENCGEPDGDGPKGQVFPNMAERKNVRWDKGSGVMVIGLPAAPDGA